MSESGEIISVIVNEDRSASCCRGVPDGLSVNATRSLRAREGSGQLPGAPAICVFVHSSLLAEPAVHVVLEPANEVMQTALPAPQPGSRSLAEALRWLG